MNRTPLSFCSEISLVVLFSVLFTARSPALQFSGSTVTFTAADQNADNTTQIQSYLNNSSYNKIIIQSGSNNKAWLVGPLNVARDNIEIDLGMNTVLEAIAGGYSSTTACLFSSQNHTNIKVLGQPGSGVLMHIEEYAFSGTSEWRHGFSFKSCSQVTLSGLSVVNTGGDGIYIGDSGTTGYSSNISITNVMVTGAGRNGLTVTSVNGLTVSNCTFQNTRPMGGVAKNGPWAGVDLEPNAPGEELKGIVFQNCAFLANAGYGFLQDTTNLRNSTDTLDIAVRNCLIQGNKSYGITIQDVPASLNSNSSILFENCSILDQVHTGLLIKGKAKAAGLLSFANCFLENNNTQPATPANFDAPISVTRFYPSELCGNIQFNNITIKQTQDRLASSLPSCIIIDGTGSSIDSISGTVYTSGGVLSTTNGTNIAVSVLSEKPATYWKLDETTGTYVSDAAGTSTGVKQNGAPWVSARIGGGLQLNGTNQYVSITSNSANLNIGTSDFSIALWFQRSNSVTANCRLFYKGASSDSDIGYAVLGSNSSIEFLLSNGITRRVISGPISGLNQWNHLVCTVARSGNMSLYINGALQQQATIGDWSSSNIVNAQNFLLGCCSGSTLFWPGQVDDVRIYHRALSPGEILDMSLKPSSYWTLNDMIGTAALDERGRCTGTVTGGTWTNGIAGGALSLNGSGQYVEMLANSSDLNVGKSNFSIALWFQRSNSVSMNSRLFYKGASSDTDIGYAMLGSNTSVEFLLSNGTIRRAVSGSISGLNQWNHMVCTLDRGGKMSLYINGVLTQNVDISDWSTIDISSIQNLFLGRCYGFTTLDWPGMIDDVRIYKRTLSADEVRKLVEAHSE